MQVTRPAVADLKIESDQEYHFTLNSHRLELLSDHYQGMLAMPWPSCHSDQHNTVSTAGSYSLPDVVRIDDETEALSTDITITAT